MFTGIPVWRVALGGRGVGEGAGGPLSLGETEEEGGGQTPRALFYFPHSYPFSILRLGATEEEGRERMWAIPLASHISYIIPLGLAEREEEGRG